VAAAKAPQIAFAEPPAGTPFRFNMAEHYAQLRQQMRWLPVRYGGEVLKTPDAPSRLILAQAAAQKAGLHEVGLSYRDVYGIINAETSWIPRLGSSKDGTPNLGIAQFEPATAKAVGLTDPLDPVQAVHAAAMHLRTPPSGAPSASRT
jgi:soluble lytic murein transglycosylase-like protein